LKKKNITIIVDLDEISELKLGRLFNLKNYNLFIPSQGPDTSHYSVHCIQKNRYIFLYIFCVF